MKLIDGRAHNLQHRKFCLDCSPFGSHNTKSDDPGRPPRKPRSYKDYPLEMRRKHSRELLSRAHALKAKLIKLAGGRCKHCGYNRCQKVLHFHHRDPSTKMFGLSASNLRAKKWETILAEAAKCDLLCANCHGEEEDRLDRVNGVNCAMEASPVGIEPTT